MRVCYFIIANSLVLFIFQLVIVILQLKLILVF